MTFDIMHLLIEGVLTSMKSATEIETIDLKSRNALWASAQYIHTFVLGDNGSLWVFQTNSKGPWRLLRNNKLDIRRISNGFNHILLLLDDRRVLAYGDTGLQITSSFGEVNLPPDEYIGLAAGTYHSCVFTRREIYSFGKNTHGQLGLGDFGSRTLPTRITEFSGKYIEEVQAGQYFTLAVADKNLYVFGTMYVTCAREENCWPRPFLLRFFCGKRIKQLSCGDNHALVLADRMVYSFGDNHFGQLAHNNSRLSCCSRESEINVNHMCFSDTNPERKIVSISAIGTSSLVLTTRGLYWCGANCFFKGKFYMHYSCLQLIDRVDTRRHIEIFSNSYKKTRYWFFFDSSDLETYIEKDEGRRGLITGILRLLTLEKFNLIDDTLDFLSFFES